MIVDELIAVFGFDLKGEGDLNIASTSRDSADLSSIIERLGDRIDYVEIETTIGDVRRQVRVQMINPPRSKE